MSESEQETPCFHNLPRLGRQWKLQYIHCCIADTKPLFLNVIFNRAAWIFFFYGSADLKRVLHTCTSWTQQLFLFVQFFLNLTVGPPRTQRPMNFSLRDQDELISQAFHWLLTIKKNRPEGCGHTGGSPAAPWSFPLLGRGSGESKKKKKKAPQLVIPAGVSRCSTLRWTARRLERD